MLIVCPKCGERCEIDFEPEVGQHIVCPFCNQKFSYGEPQDDAGQAGTVMAVCPYCGYGESVGSDCVGQVRVCSQCRGEFTILADKVGVPFAAGGNSGAQRVNSSAKTSFTPCRVNFNKLEAEVDANLGRTHSPLKILVAIISLVGSVLLFLYCFPSWISVLRGTTGTDLGLSEVIYDDSDCCLEVAAAISEGNMALAHKWAERIRDDRIRRMIKANIKTAEDLQNLSW